MRTKKLTSCTGCWELKSKMTVPTTTETEKANTLQGYEYFANQIMYELSFKTLRDTEEILIYQNGIYKKGGESYIKEKCQKIIPNCSTNKAKEVINIIKRTTYVTREEFDTNPNYLNLENGILNLTTGKLQEHSPKYLFRIQLPVKYQEGVVPTKFNEFLKSSLPDEENRTNAMEAFASTLLLDLKLEKMIMNVGEGANGKSTFLSVIEHFLGSENVSNTSIHDLLYNQFAKSRLDGKMANIYSDISRRELPELGSVKALISGDTLDVERKHQNEFKLKNTAKMIFSCNELPEIGEESHAVYRRLLLVQWSQKFTHDGENKIKPNLLKELTTKNEISGILNELIIVTKRLRENGKFTNGSNSSDLQRIWSLKSDPIGKFLDSNVAQDFVSKMPKVKLFNEFQNWCKNNRITPKSEKAFNVKVKETFGISPTTLRIEQKPTKVWQGLKIMEDVTSETAGAAISS